MITILFRTGNINPAYKVKRAYDNLINDIKQLNTRIDSMHDIYYVKNEDGKAVRISVPPGTEISDGIKAEIEYQMDGKRYDMCLISRGIV